MFLKTAEHANEIFQRLVGRTPPDEQHVRASVPVGFLDFLIRRLIEVGEVQDDRMNPDVAVSGGREFGGIVLTDREIQFCDARESAHLLSPPFQQCRGAWLERFEIRCRGDIVVADHLSTGQPGKQIVYI